MGQTKQRLGRARGFLSSLARDVRANTMAIMAVAMIPLAGLVGGAVDVSRLYIVKTRLQHACDAGALAGRKTMGGGTWNQTVNGVADYPKIAANKFFDANISASPYGAKNLNRSYAESGGKVTGTVSADVPMTLMTIFGQQSQTLNITCDAEMRLPNTDIMFVLDTTGSMGDTPSGDTQTKMASLKVAVKCFYEIVAKLNTDATCTTGAPSGGTGNQVQIRFGFVPYSTNVNVGKLLPTSYFANSWTYQSREAQWNDWNENTYPNGPVDTNGSNGNNTSSWGGWSNVSYSWYGCPNVPYPNPQYNVAGNFSVDTTVNTDANGVRTWQTRTYTRVNINYQTYWYGSRCYLQSRQQGTGTYTVVNHTQTPVIVAHHDFSQWHYAPIAQPISGLKNGTSWNSSFQLPIGSNGTNKTINWPGCIEERATVRQSSYDPLPSGAKDLNIDLVPSQSDATTLWAPALPDIIYTREDPGGWWGGSDYWDMSDAYTTDDYVNGSSAFCPTEAKKLQSWTDPDAFDTYVDSLSPSGNTYHDIGLLWGGRLMSPTGIFASENATTPQGGDIERHMIFMTDGDPCTAPENYTAYGVQWFDRRQTSLSSVPSGGCTTTGTLTAQVNARTEALCKAIKNKNITLWVITFGYVDPTTVTRMTNCASSGKYFSANNAAQIQATFKSIADQISQLRLTK